MVTHSNENEEVELPTTPLGMNRVIAFAMVVALTSALFTPTAGAAAAKPTKAIVEAVLKSSWDKAATNFSPRAILTLNSVKFGKSSKATLQQVQVEGIPKNATVTPAIVDFSVRTYYTTQTQVVRRVRNAIVYKDAFSEWAVMTGTVRGQDVTTSEAPAG